MRQRQRPRRGNKITGNRSNRSKDVEVFLVAGMPSSTQYNGVIFLCLFGNNPKIILIFELR